MTGLMVDDFPAFFRAVNEGRTPFAWQTRLLEHLVAERRWPDRIDAPTGSGKNAVVEAHVFAVAVTAAARGGDARDLPRRLVVTVDRRALVDNHADRAARLSTMLVSARDDASAPEVVRAVSAALLGLRPHDDSAEPLEVAVLRGGLKPSRGWLDSPSACQVIAATPDMWGSRLLFNGYGSSRWAHPREAGLLAFDSAVVLDEGHLNQQLLRTARRVRDLTVADARRLGIPALQVTQMSATPAAGEETAVGVVAADLDTDRVLRDRLRTAKPVRLRPCADWPATRGTMGRVADTLVEEVRAALAATDGTVGCVVNTVRLAIEVTDRLRRAAPPGGARSRPGLEVRQIVGRMRPWDIEALRAEHPGLFRLGGDPDIDVVVATQTIEVGVDMDFAALVTELAPGSALAQRAGRVNRAGSRDAGPVTVVVPADVAALAGKPAGPYHTDELTDALAWLGRRAEDSAGLAPWVIHAPTGGDGPPAATARRPVFHRVEWWDIDLWARTSDTLFADHDLDLWLSDDVKPDDLTAAVVVRQGLPDDALQVPDLLRATPPQPHEMFPARLGELRTLIADTATATERRFQRLFLMRGDEVTPVEVDGLGEVTLRPEDVVVLDDTARVFRANVVALDGGETADDVSERQATTGTGRTVRFHPGAPILYDTDRPNDVLSEIREAAAKDAADGQDGAGTGRWPALGVVLREWLATTGTCNGMRSAESRELLTALLARTGDREAEVTVRADSGENFWVVITGTVAHRDDEEARQAWTPHHGPVLLQTHQGAVHAAAEQLCTLVGVPETARIAVTMAGLLHDEGKADPRFQRALRNRDTDHPGKVLAKSGMRSMQAITRARERSGLPTGWRHEQLSAAVAWERLRLGEPLVRDVAVRLVGTSHGRGRSGYPHTADQLCATGQGAGGAVELFTDAEWDLLLDRTNREWGIWGCAYLEALLRAADGTMSRRGL